MSHEELQRRFTALLSAMREIRALDHLVDINDATRVAGMSRIAGAAIRAAIAQPTNGGLHGTSHQSAPPAP
jgi:hypothetical protein